MTYLLPIARFLSVFIGVFSFFLGLFILFHNRRQKINQLFSSLCFISSFWMVCTYAMALEKLSSFWRLFFTKGSFVVVLFFILIAYFFTHFFPKKGKSYKNLDFGIIGGGLLFFLITAFTPFVIENAVKKEWGTEVVLGKYSLFYFGFIIFLIIFAIYRMYSKYFKLSPEEKLKVQYLIIGASIFAFLNLVFNIIVPLKYKTYKYYFFGDFSLIFLLSFTALAIIKKELFGIKVLLTEFLVSLIAIVLLVQIFLSQNLELKLLNIAVFLLFLFFGYLLIKSVIKEISQTEKLKRVSEELKLLNEKLEQKVKERTKELEKQKKIAQERAEELEKWYKLTVGRELRMAELKEKIKKLEERLKREKLKDNEEKT